MSPVNHLKRGITSSSKLPSLDNRATCIHCCICMPLGKYKVLRSCTAKCRFCQGEQDIYYIFRKRNPSPEKYLIEKCNKKLPTTVGNRTRILSVAGRTCLVNELEIVSIY